MVSVSIQVIYPRRRAKALIKKYHRLLCSNFCLVIFLSLKNTPLAVLSAYSYERLNGLHQIAGYTTFGYLVLHAAMYSQYFIAAGRSKIFEEPSVIAGIVAGFGFLGVFLSGAVLRHIWYEAFYVSHIVCFLLALVGGAMHQPDITENGLLIMMLVVAGLWGADRLLRAARMLFRSFNNYAVVEPLPHGGTKITLAKRPYGAVGGKHCFVWIPRVRLFESHPFTIAGTEPMEFVVNAHDGFTRDLHQYAVANPGARLKASVDGPYGTFPDPMSAEFDKVVLIAGGSGATFTFGLATNMLERMGPNSTKNIVFIWAVKKHGKPGCSSLTIPYRQYLATLLFFLTRGLVFVYEGAKSRAREALWPGRSISAQIALCATTDSKIRHEGPRDASENYISLHSISMPALATRQMLNAWRLRYLLAHIPTHDRPALQPVLCHRIRSKLTSLA